MTCDDLERNERDPAPVTAQYPTGDKMSSISVHAFARVHRSGHANVTFTAADVYLMRFQNFRFYSIPARTLVEK